MNKYLSRYLSFYPITMLHGEFIAVYVRKYESFQTMTPEEIVDYQTKALKKLLLHAKHNSIFYSRLYQDIDVHNFQVSNLALLPTITKNEIVNNKNEIITRNSVFDTHKTTGGSTGRAVTIIKNPTALARERAATARAYRWAGIEIGDKQFRFWGIPIQKINKLKYKVIDYIANRKRASAFSITDAYLETISNEINKFKPAYIYGYVSAVAELASYYKRHSLTVPDSVKSVITTSEILTTSLRNHIESSFKRKVFNEYGCGEVGSIAHECELGNMHIMSDNIIVECINELGEVTSDGEIVVTDLFNYSMPLIRYRLGDYATLEKGLCDCGRTLPLIKNIHGRAYDMIQCKDGKKLHPESVMYIFEEVKDKFGTIEQFQVIQQSYELFKVYIKKDKGYSEYTEEYLASRFKEKVCKDSKLVFIYVNEIPREKSGKLRLIKSEI